MRDIDDGRQRTEDGYRDNHDPALSPLRRLSSVVRRPWSYSHRHQHIECALALTILNEGGRARISELEHRRFAVELRSDVQQIARVETDIERLRPVFDFELLGGTTRIRVCDRKQELAAAQGEFHGAAALARYRGHSVDRVLEFQFVHDKLLVLAACAASPIL